MLDLLFSRVSVWSGFGYVFFFRSCVLGRYVVFVFVIEQGMFRIWIKVV